MGLFLILFDEDICQTTFSTVLSIRMAGHENSSSTFFIGTFTSQSGDFTILIYLVIFKDSQFNLLLLVFVLFWCGVILLLTFLSTTTETKDKMKGRFLLDVVVGQCSAIFQLFTSKDQSLLVRGNSFFVLNLGFNIFFSHQPPSRVFGLQVVHYADLRQDPHGQNNHS